MKESSTKKNFQGIVPAPSDDTLENNGEKYCISSKAVKTNMTEQLVIPPARIWNKIEKILDEQDERRKHAENLITASFSNTKNLKKSKTTVLAAVGGISLIAGLIWVML